MNIIQRCYRHLFGAYGHPLFDAPSVLQALGPVVEALQKCHQAAVQVQKNPTGSVRVQGKRALRIPGGVMKIVASTCSPHFADQAVLCCSSPQMLASQLGCWHLPVWFELSGVQLTSRWSTWGPQTFSCTHGPVLVLSAAPRLSVYPQG